MRMFKFFLHFVSLFCLLDIVNVHSVAFFVFIDHIGIDRDKWGVWGLYAQIK